MILKKLFKMGNKHSKTTFKKSYYAKENEQNTDKDNKNDTFLTEPCSNLCLKSKNDRDEYQQTLLNNSYDDSDIHNLLNFKIYKPNKINLFYNQNIEDIRRVNKQFTDDIFKPSAKALIGDITKPSAIELFVNLNDYSNDNMQNIDLKNLNLNDLDKKIKWKRCQVK